MANPKQGKLVNKYGIFEEGPKELVCVLDNSTGAWDPSDDPSEWLEISDEGVQAAKARVEGFAWLVVNRATPEI